MIVKLPFSLPHPFQTSGPLIAYISALCHGPKQAHDQASLATGSATNPGGTTSGPASRRLSLALARQVRPRVLWVSVLLLLLLLLVRVFVLDSNVPVVALLAPVLDQPAVHDAQQPPA
ncbi:hypothetical protein G7K_4238-t1 [Saitoella complicata NRRL Y-17804]|uniref:Uncharacterized protein n=1 Tax=Saitoella complicata (strain BCRC 22490 / CBS 7301 / JCM 7358 / NBRC 10748 / NRRL Y-17804) TaxID=698492 RepID=A0A0E9NJX1_SAICN|nr:hypothetical protein G7K_4238-t1 [Saitoella complicata NRRL Y-17804]